MKKKHFKRASKWGIFVRQKIKTKNKNKIVWTTGFLTAINVGNFCYRKKKDTKKNKIVWTKGILKGHWIEKFLSTSTKNYKRQQAFYTGTTLKKKTFVTEKKIPQKNKMIWGTTSFSNRQQCEEFC